MAKKSKKPKGKKKPPAAPKKKKDPVAELMSQPIPASDLIKRVDRIEKVIRFAMKS
ncbi:MAG: hypothetical protein KAV87_51605 [Desulfobacteraceae bacterium]|nr:hypothetical protein [Desulfobacteraceae bacterium]